MQRRGAHRSAMVGKAGIEEEARARLRVRREGALDALRVDDLSHELQELLRGIGFREEMLHPQPWRVATVSGERSPLAMITLASGGASSPRALRSSRANHP